MKLSVVKLCCMTCLLPQNLFQFSSNLRPQQTYLEMLVRIIGIEETSMSMVRVNDGI